MTSWVHGFTKLVVAGALILSISLLGVGAQKKKKKTRRTSKPVAARPVITNPDIAPPSTTEGDIKIISTADQDPTSDSTTKKPKSTTSATEQKDEIQQSITTLSNQVNRLNDKLSQMQEDDRYQIDMERLTRAEQRAEQVRSQLIDTQSKLADLESKRDQVDYNLKPENIDRSTTGMGTVHPEEAREARRKQLENEKSRLEAQIKILESSKTRLETSLASADAEVDTLRAKLEQRRAQMDADQTSSEPKPKKP
jgi:DNA repair exonuclease SbcCD ATPase subunit